MHPHEVLPRYCAYLLRCWQEQGLTGSTTTTWRFSLEDPHTGARRGFASFEALIAFLEGELGAGISRTQAGAAGE